MADDEWEDTLVTSWTYPDKRTTFHVSEMDSFYLGSDNRHHFGRSLMGVLRSTHPAGCLTFLYNRGEHSQAKEIHSVVEVDHQHMKTVSDVYNLAFKEYRVIGKGSKYFTGVLSSEGAGDLLVDSDGVLTFGGHNVKVKLGGTGFSDGMLWVDYFKRDRTGVVYVDRNDEQIRELRGENIISYPKLTRLVSFSATEPYIFVLHESGSGCQLTRLDRNDPNTSQNRELVSFSSLHFECMQAHNQYLLVCFRSKMGDKTLVDGFKDHHLFMYRTADLSFMQKLTFSSCGFLPQKLHTKNTWDFLRQQKLSKDIQHVPSSNPRIPYPATLSGSDVAQLSTRNISGDTYTSVNQIKEMLIFPHEGDERVLAVALHTRAEVLYLFVINKGKLSQCDGLRLFHTRQVETGQQSRLFPTPDQKGIVAISNTCMLEKISLKKYLINT